MSKNYDARSTSLRGVNDASMARSRDHHLTAHSSSSVPRRKQSSRRESQDSRSRRSPESHRPRLQDPSPRRAEERGRSAARSHTGSRPSSSRSKREIPPSPDVSSQRFSRDRTIFPPRRERCEPPRSGRHNNRVDRFTLEVERLFQALGR